MWSSVFRRFLPRVEMLEDRTVPSTLYAIASNNNLWRFDSASPGIIQVSVSIQGLTLGEALQGIDFRPATGQLYGLAVAGVTGRLVVIDPTTGFLTQVGNSFTVNGTSFGFDFNPVTDRIRVVSNANINLSINPNNAAVTTQTPLNPGLPDVIGSAYSNNLAGATTTTLYGIDANTDRLVIQNSGSGTLTDVGTGLGVNTLESVGFDIEGLTGTAFAALQLSLEPFSRLFTINLANGVASEIGPISSTFFVVRGLAVAPAGAGTGRIPATGADAGAAPHVRVFNPVTGAEVFSFFAFAPSFRGGVRVATGDINHDGVFDIVTGAGPGGGPHVRVFSGATGQQLGGAIGSFFAFVPSFSGGVFVAADDVNNDGFDDVIVGAGQGGGPHVRVFSGADGSELRSFFAYVPTFTGGVRVAAADFNNDGLADIVTGTGVGGGPHVRVFSGADPNVELASFFAYSANFGGGIFVAAGDVNGDGQKEIITGPGAGPGLVRYFSTTGAEIGRLLAYPEAFTGGVRVATADTNGDGRLDVLVAPGPGVPQPVRSIDALTLGELDAFFAYGIFTGGVFVAGRG